MSKYTNDIEQFIYEFCYQPLWDSVNSFLYNHLYTLGLSFSKIKYPDSASLSSMMLEFPTNIMINEDNLIFDAILSCSVHLEQDDYVSARYCDFDAWLRVSCCTTITDQLE